MGGGSLTRRFLLLSVLGGSLTGCGAGNSDTVNPNVLVDWGSVPTRTMPLIKHVAVPGGTQSVVVTFEGASATTEGADVVIRGTRPGTSSVLSNGLSVYGYTKLVGTERIWRRATRVRIDCYRTLDATGRSRQTISMITPNKNGECHSLSSKFRVIRKQIAGVVLDVNGSEEVTIPVGGIVPLKLKYTYPESVQESYAPDFAELQFFATHSMDGLEKIATPRELILSPDEHGNPGVGIEAIGVGTMRLFAYVDGKQSNSIAITVVPA